MENNKQVAKASPDLSMQLMRQKETYLTAVQVLKGRSEIANDKEASVIIAALFERKIMTYDLSKEEDIDAMINLVSSWRLRVGCMKDSTSEQLIVEAKYLINTWGHLSPADISNAIEIMTQDKLDLKQITVYNFSTLFMGQVLASYMRYRSPVIHSVVNIVEEAKAIAPVEVSMQQRIENMQDMLVFCYNHRMEGFRERFFNRLVYDFLRKSGRMKFNDEIVAQARAHADDKYAKWLKTLIDPRVGRPTKEEQDKRLRQYGIDFCLDWFFANNKVMDVYNSITEKDFPDEIKKKTK